MAESIQQDLWPQASDEILASPPNPDMALEHQLWGNRQRMELLRALAAHALTGGQPLVAATLYQQIADLEDRCRVLRQGLGSPE